MLQEVVVVNKKQENWLPFSAFRLVASSATVPLSGTRLKLILMEIEIRVQPGLSRTRTTVKASSDFLALPRCENTF